MQAPSQNWIPLALLLTIPALYLILIHPLLWLIPFSSFIFHEAQAGGLAVIPDAYILNVLHAESGAEKKSLIHL